MGNFAPLIAAVPLIVIERNTVGFIVQTWRAPLEGWTELTEPQLFSDVHGAAQEQSRRIMTAGGATVSLSLEPMLLRIGNGGRS